MARKKGTKISAAKAVRKNEKRRCKRKFMNPGEKKKSSESRELRRIGLKERKQDEAIESLSSSSETPSHRTSDRKFVEKNVASYNIDLQDNSCTNLVQLFGKKLESIKWHNCPVCHTKTLGVISTCWCKKNYIMKTNLIALPPVPDVLSDLSIIEQLLISRVHPVVQVYRLVGGQTGYSGHVINFFQDVKDVAKHLPHTVENIRGIINVSYDTLKFHKNFRIRKKAVLDALKFLKTYNKYYRDIIIDEKAVGLLPENDSFHGSIQSTEEESDAEEDQNIISSAVPSSAVHDPKEKLYENSMPWPKIDSNPINELCNYYIAQAFPSLFPYGEADLKEVRSRHLTPRAYFQYLMEFHDHRFAKHKIFPYFALNTVMRWECLSKGTVYMKEHPDIKKMNMAFLADMIKKNPAFMKDILVYGSNIRGTKEFWASRSGELEALCDYLDLPAVFFTVSSADMRWPRLKDLILERMNISEASDKAYYQLVIDNPKVCSDYFYEMFTLFFESIVLGAFQVVDYWYRYEWQMRGSPHVHGVLWLKDSPDVKLLEEKFEETKEAIIAYYDSLISCESPNINFVETGAHPCSTRIKDVTSVEDDLSALINSVQMHLCSQKCTKNGTQPCRYGFPKELKEESELALNKKKYYEFLGRRNHPQINQHNRQWLQALRSNGDWTAILSDKGFRQYIAKYTSKGETKSRPLLEILSSVLSEKKPSTALSTVQKSFMAALVERDYSSQEVHHLISGKKLYSCSRSFVKVHLKSNDWKYHIHFDANGTVHDNFNHILHSYSKRPQKLHNVSLLQFVEMFNIESYTPRSRKAVAMIYPRLKCTGKEIDISEIARQLVLLHVPWTSIDAVCGDKGWIEMMEMNNLVINQLPYHKSAEIKDALCHEVSDEELDCNESVDKASLQDDWMAFVSASLGDEPEAVPTESTSENSYPWSENKCSPEESLEWNKFVAEAKANGIDHVLRYRNDNMQFSEDQKCILNLVSCQISCLKDNGNGLDNFPQLMLCQGMAGCGKTRLISEIEIMVTEAFGADSILIVAFTGCSAINANGRTIHSAFRLQFDKKGVDIVDLKGESLKNFQEKMANVKIIILEEYSMIGGRLLNIINKRCMQMKSSNKPFGGLPVYMFGDLHQLPPICDTPLYQMNVDPDKVFALAGSLLFKSLVRTQFLTVHHRQEDPEFIHFLDELGTGVISSKGKEYIMDRFEENLSEEELDSFSDAIHLYQYRKQAKSFNEWKLNQFKKPVISIAAENNNKYAAATSDDIAGHLENDLRLCIGARVMLRANLWTEGGLVNGSVGYVHDIVFCDNISKTKPAYILVKFVDYYGPTLDNGCVPIPRVLKSWHIHNVYCTRYQFPLNLAYALTVHKSQGLTLYKAVLHFDAAEMSPGLFYVAMSRVRKKNDLVIAGSSLHSPLFNINLNNYKSKMEGKEWLISKSL